MNGKIAAVLLAATMLTTPAFAATVANSHNAPTTQTEHRTRSPQNVGQGHEEAPYSWRASYGHKVHHVKHAMPNQAKHAKRFQKRA